MMSLMLKFSCFDLSLFGVNTEYFDEQVEVPMFI